MAGSKLLTRIETWECVFDHGGPCTRREDPDHDPWNTPKKWRASMPNECKRLAMRTTAERRKLLTWGAGYVILKGRSAVFKDGLYVYPDHGGALREWLVECGEKAGREFYAGKGGYVSMTSEHMHALDHWLAREVY